MLRLRWLAITAVFLFAGAAAAANIDMAPEDLRSLMDDGAPPLIIDVRSGWEYARGHLPGAEHMPFWLSLSRAGALDAPRDEPVILYCEHGPRAALAA